MLFTKDILNFKTALGQLWLAGTIGVRRKPFNKEIIVTADIGDLVNALFHTKEPVAPRLSGTFLAGLCAILNQKCHFFQADLMDVLRRLHYHDPIDDLAPPDTHRRKRQKKIAVTSAAEIQELEQAIQEVFIGPEDDNTGLFFQLTHTLDDSQLEDSLQNPPLFGASSFAARDEDLLLPASPCMAFLNGDADGTNFDMSDLLAPLEHDEYGFTPSARHKASSPLEQQVDQNGFPEEAPPLIEFSGGAEVPPQADHDGPQMCEAEVGPDDHTSAAVAVDELNESENELIMAGQPAATRPGDWVRPSDFRVRESATVESVDAHQRQPAHRQVKKRTQIIVDSSTCFGDDILQNWRNNPPYKCGLNSAMGLGPGANGRANYVDAMDEPTNSEAVVCPRLVQNRGLSKLIDKVRQMGTMRKAKCQMAESDDDTDDEVGGNINAPANKRQRLVSGNDNGDRIETMVDTPPLDEYDGDVVVADPEGRQLSEVSDWADIGGGSGRRDRLTAQVEKLRGVFDADADALGEGLEFGSDAGGDGRRRRLSSSVGRDDQMSRRSSVVDPGDPMSDLFWTQNEFMGNDDVMMNEEDVLSDLGNSVAKRRSRSMGSDVSPHGDKTTGDSSSFAQLAELTESGSQPGRHPNVDGGLTSNYTIATWRFRTFVERQFERKKKGRGDSVLPGDGSHNTPTQEREASGISGGDNSPLLFSEIAVPGMSDRLTAARSLYHLLVLGTAGDCYLEQGEGYMVDGGNKAAYPEIKIYENRELFSTSERSSDCGNGDVPAGGGRESVAWSTPQFSSASVQLDRRIATRGSSSINLWADSSDNNDTDIEMINRMRARPTSGCGSTALSDTNGRGVSPSISLRSLINRNEDIMTSEGSSTPIAV